MLINNILYTFDTMKQLIILSFILAITSCSSDDNQDCNCNGAIYKNVYTDELKSFHNEPMHCDTGTPKEPVKEDKWYFVECKDKPSY